MFDVKKEYKRIYQPDVEPAVIIIPSMQFVVIKGKGDPNTSPEYANAIQALYGIAYHIKMNHKDILEYVVPPLEGLWWVDDEHFKGGGSLIRDKSKFIWRLQIRQPDFVTPELFDKTKEIMQRKKPAVNFSGVYFEKKTEGLCVQALHVGSYDTEGSTVRAIEEHTAKIQCRIDINEQRWHHEIYLSDPRKTTPDKLKTIIRHPIAKI